MPKYKRGSGSIYKRGKTWWLKYYVNGKPVYESAKTKDRAEGRRVLAKRLGELAEGRYVGHSAERVTFDELADDLVRDYQQKEHRSIKDLQTRINKHLRPVLGGRAAHSITRATCATT